LTTPTISTNSDINKWGVKRHGLPDQRSALFNSVEDFKSRIDELCEMVAPWMKGQIVDTSGEVSGEFTFYYRDTLAVLQEILANAHLKEKCVWSPVRKYDPDGNRVYTDIHTGDWQWRMQASTLANSADPRNSSIVEIAAGGVERSFR